MDYLEFKNYLSHHGVKGMKWGVRKEEDESEAEFRRKKELKEIEYRQQRSAQRSQERVQSRSERARIFCEANVRKMNKDELKSQERQQKGRKALITSLVVIGGLIVTRGIRKTIKAMNKPTK